MVATQFYLPDDCWESVFKFLDNGIEDINNRQHYLKSFSVGSNSKHHYLKSLSLVSKQFLSITNTLQFSLNVHNPTHAFLHCLFKRFTNLTSLNLTNFHGDLDALLSQIASFRLNLISLDISTQPVIPANGLRAFSLKIATLTSLTCLDIRFVKSSDLFLIAECFPLLEELNLNNPREDFILDQNIETFSWALFKLRKVNLCGRYFINDQVLHHFFKNCKLLEEVIISHYPGLTSAGIASSLRERPTLRSLSLSNNRFEQLYDDKGQTSHFIDSLVSLKGLRCIDWSRLRISDKLLYSIAREGLPLTRLFLRNCTGYSYDGLLSLLSKCQRIQHLNLQNAYFLKDEHVVELSLFLGDLVSINLSDCNMLTISALFALVRKCPSLNEIKMGRSSNGEINHQLKSLNLKKVENSNSLMDCVVNHQLKSLSLAFYQWLMDEDINMFAPIFSNLQLLDLSDCYYISDASIGQVLNRCYKIRHLNLSGCKGVKLHRLNFEFLKLEILDLSCCTSIDDETLYVILKSCCEGLLQLNLRKCYQITKKGVMHVVKYCTQLKEINLANCCKVPANVVASMVFLRPSLRKIFCPSHSYFSDIEKKNFLHRHGCHVS